MSYNGYYISFPRKRRGSDSLHSHQTIIRKSIYTLYFYGRPSEKDREAGLLAPGCENKSIYALYFYGRLYEKDYVVVLLVLFFCPTYLQNLMIMLVPYFIIPNSYNLTGFRLQISILKQLLN